jgi:hypothetical protein
MTPRRVGVLAAQIAADPATATGAALRGWSDPTSRERLVLMDLFDLTHRGLATKEVPEYPRPWPNQDVKHHGKTTRSRAEIEAILVDHGHQIEGRGVDHG